MEPLAAAAAPPPTSGPLTSVTAATPTAGSTTLRRGLPRLVGGEPWPEAGEAPISLAVTLPASECPSTPDASEITGTESLPDPATAVSEASETRPLSPAAGVMPRPRRRFAELPKLGRAVIAVAGSLVLAALIVLVARWLLSTPAMQDFIAQYPGETALPDAAPLGLPAWLGWQHFFNVFLMVLIVRSGLGVRHEKRPAAYWASRP